MRRWLRDPPAETAQTALTPSPIGRPKVSAVPAVSATPAEPENWSGLMRGLTVPGVGWALAADALDSLMDWGGVERALILGWHPHELIGVQRARPHDNPFTAGVLFSLRYGDRVEGISDNGCGIVPAGSKVRHLWRRSPLPADDSICLPWELR